MAGKSKKPLDPQLVVQANDFVRAELELALTFINVAQTRSAMGHTVGANSARDNAKKAYEGALKYCRKFNLNPASPGLANLLNEVRDRLLAPSKKKE